MTTATTEGRRLSLNVDGVDGAFLVDPLHAKRGKHLTEQFILASVGQIPQDSSEAIFIEALGPVNYARMTGLYVDLVMEHTDDYPEPPHTIDVILTYDDSGLYAGDPEVSPVGMLMKGAYYRARSEQGDEPELMGEPIRQQEAEALCLAAFYWQTVVGMEAVEAFIEGGEGTAGSLKALGLLQTRLVLSASPSSRSAATEQLIQQQANSTETTDTPPSSATVRLLAHKRGFNQNPLKNRQK